MTLIIENANAETLRVIESLKGFNRDLIITQDGDTKNDECKICKSHNYTPKMTKAMKKAFKESENISKNPHKYPSYKSIEALREALESDD